MPAIDADLESQRNAFVHAQMRDLDSAEPALEVVVLWGEQSVLHVAHLNPPRAFYVGDADASGNAAIDLVLGAESIGSQRLPIALHEDGHSLAVIPHGASGYIECDGQLLGFDELAAQGLITPCAQLPGAHQIRLGQAMRARVEYRGFCFLVQPTLAARRIGVASLVPVDWQASRFTLGSVMLHLGLLLLFYLAPPSSTVLAIDRLGGDSRLVNYLVTPDESVLPEPNWDALNETPSDEGGDPGHAAEGDPGQAGKRDAPKTHHKMAVAGPADNEVTQLARNMAQGFIASKSIIGILKANVGEVNAPTSPFGRERAEGSNPISAAGALLGTTFGVSGGNGGLAMIGTGVGGGGRPEGAIGVGVLGTTGVGSRVGPGYGTLGGTLHGRTTRMPIVRVSAADVRGSLSKEVIRRTIALHLKEVRFCYEQSLQTRPELQGRVAVKFMIGASGAVTLAVAASSDLGDGAAEQCILDAVKRWDFPAPEGGGLVTVTYPFVLQQVGG